MTLSWWCPGSVVVNRKIDLGPGTWSLHRQRHDSESIISKQNLSTPRIDTPDKNYAQ